MTTERTTAQIAHRRLMAYVGMLVLATAAGMTAGWRLKPDRPDAALAPPPAGSREAMADRNTFWRVWNGKEDEVRDGPAKSLALALGAAIRPDTPMPLRDRAMGALMNKSVLYFSEEEIDEVMTVLLQGEPADRVEILRRIIAADARAGAMVQGVLADKQRIGLFAAGKPIPLETLPDGTAP